MRVLKITKALSQQSYKLFDADLLNIGDTVFADIYIKKSSEYVIIIEAGVELSEKLYNLLKKQTQLYIIDTAGSIHRLSGSNTTMGCNTLLTQVKHFKNDLKKTLRLLYEVNNQMFTAFSNDDNNKINLLCAEAIVESILFLLQKDENYLKKVMPLLHNDYKLPIHSLNVSLYALHIGNLLHFSNEELLKLGKASLLHDVGKKRICSIINKNDPLTQEEIELTKQHSQYSIEILKENNIEDKAILDGVAQHHERYDGSGYPNQLLKSETSDFGSILAICDVFDALTVYKPNRKSHTTFESLKIMLKDSSMRGQFNDKYIKLLLV